MSSKQMFYTTLGKKFNNPNALYVELTFDAVPAFSKSIAPLLYDKKFAYGIRLDDGLYKAFTNVFAVLYGGIADENNNVHSGFRSTDSCGNDIIWQGDFALPIMNAGTDQHSNELSINYIRWSTLRFARDMGFGVLYHGYELPTMDEIKALPTASDRYNALLSDLQNWKDYVTAKMGFTPLVATVPSGTDELMNIDPLANGEFHCPFKEKGFWAIDGRKTPSILGGVNRPLNLHPGLPVDAITMDYFNNPSYFPCDFHFTGATDVAQTIETMKANVTEMHTNAGYFAKQFFTHNITYNANEGSLNGMTIDEFKSFMTWIDANYGKTSGLDEVLFTSSQSVLEYVYCRLNTVVNEYKEGNKVILEIIPPAFSGMRRPALTFKINSNIAVKNINIHNINRFSQNVLNNTSGIINVEWSNEYYAAADRFVTTLESSQSPQDKNYAQFLTNLVSKADLKNALQARINAVTIITSTIWLFDFGVSTTGYQSDNPYNNCTDVTSGKVYSGLIKTPSAATTLMTLTIGAGFTTGSSCYYPSYGGSYQSRVANDGYFIDFALRDYFTVAQGTPAIITISGLNNSKKYDIAAIANRHSITSTTKYTVYNDVTSPTFSANQSCLGRNPTALNGNFDNPAIITNAIPLNGILYLKVEGVSSAGFINALKITEHD